MYDTTQQPRSDIGGLRPKKRKSSSHQDQSETEKAKKQSTTERENE
jgi:hypothetical protein